MTYSVFAAFPSGRRKLCFDAVAVCVINLWVETEAYRGCVTLLALVLSLRPLVLGGFALLNPCHDG